MLLFATHTCPNCKTAEAMLTEAGIPFTKIYADDEKELAKHYKIMLAPTFVVPAGDDVEKYRGVSDIQGWINAQKK